MSIRVSRRLILGAGLLCVTGWQSRAGPPPERPNITLPPERLYTLARGANISTLFEQNRDLGGDLSQIAKDGFRHIRVFVDAAKLADKLYMDRLDWLVSEAITGKLGTILTLSSDSFARDNEGAHHQQGWIILAKRFRALNPNLVFFELANEPTMTARVWDREQEQLRQTVRGIAAQHTIILVGAPLSMVWSLPEITAPDDNVVYAFHLYQPMVVTHQGADWDPQYKPFKGLTYPPNPMNIKKLTNARTAESLAQYAEHGKAMMQREIDRAANWSKEHRMPVMVTEFGIFGEAPPATRAAWLGEARQRLEAAHIGWTIWEYEGGFGVAPLLPGSPLAQALGLR